MDGRHRARTTAIAVLAVVLGAVAVPAAGSQSPAVLWQGSTPEDGTAVVAAVGRELRVPLEASGPIDSSVRVTAEQLPAGARIEQRGQSPVQATFRWKPRLSQLGDRRLVFRATSGGSSVRLRLWVHVGRTAARTFRLSSTAIGGRSQNAVLLRPVDALARPADNARFVARLNSVTPEHVPHVLFLTRGRIGPDGRYWLQVPLPVLPNGTTGWIPREAVGEFATVDTHLVIDRARLRATLYKRGRRVFQSIVGVGEPRWPTPAGRFYIRERLTGFTDPIYGSLAFGTNGRSAVLTDWPGGGFIGIHGTNQPQILPGRVSHGCVRLRNPSIRRLDRLMKVGTPVTIR